MALENTTKDATLSQKILDLSGENISKCYQCGLCSARCLISSETNFFTRLVIRFAQLDKTEVLESKAIWLCLSCLSCRIKCPRGINLGTVMETLRQISLMKGVDKYAVRCNRCGRLFLTTPLQIYIKARLKDKTINEEILNLCPSCKKYYHYDILEKKLL
jgi:heterodisulfide reductase subunit C